MGVCGGTRCSWILIKCVNHCVCLWECVFSSGAQNQAEPVAFSFCGHDASRSWIYMKACAPRWQEHEILISLISSLCPPPVHTTSFFPFVKLPWKSLTSIIEYYYMWKTTDRYVQQVRLIQYFQNLYTSVISFNIFVPPLYCNVCYIFVI